MLSITDLIPSQVLQEFLRRHMKSKLLVVAVSGAHAYGYPHPRSPLELKGIHVEPTERLVGLIREPTAYNWVEEYEGYRIDYSSIELGEAFSRLLRGDGSILERIMSPRQIVMGDDLRRLQKVTRGIICRRFYSYYRNFARGLSHDKGNGARHSVRHVLGVYRTALTGVYLLRNGKVELDLQKLAKRYRLSRISELVKVHQRDPEAELEPDSPWLKRIVKLHTLYEEAIATTRLPIDPDNPGGVEDYLLDMRRRFFDAPTIRE
jgi:hypothetical protein